MPNPKPKTQEEQDNEMERDDFLLVEKSPAECQSRNENVIQCVRPLGHKNEGPKQNHFGLNRATGLDEFWD